MNADEKWPGRQIRIITETDRVSWEGSFYHMSIDVLRQKRESDPKTRPGFRISFREKFSQRQK